MQGYTKRIGAVTGLTDPKIFEDVENVMRDAIFHSTLDWVPPKQFDAAAKQAYGIVRLTRRPRAPLILPEDAGDGAPLGRISLGYPEVGRGKRWLKKIRRNTKSASNSPASLTAMSVWRSRSEGFAGRLRVGAAFRNDESVRAANAIAGISLDKQEQ